MHFAVVPAACIALYKCILRLKEGEFACVSIEQLLQLLLLRCFRCP